MIMLIILGVVARSGYGSGRFGTGDDQRLGGASSPQVVLRQLARTRALWRSRRVTVSAPNDRAMEGVSSAQTGGERARLAPEVSLAGVPRGPKEGAIVVVEPSSCLGDIDIVVAHGGT